MTLNKGFRRASTLVLLVLGGFFLWLAPETATGVTLLLIGVILEVIGIAVERR